MVPGRLFLASLNNGLLKRASMDRRLSSLLVHLFVLILISVALTVTTDAYAQRGMGAANAMRSNNMMRQQQQMRRQQQMQRQAQRQLNQQRQIQRQRQADRQRRAIQQRQRAMASQKQLRQRQLRQRRAKSTQQRQQGSNRTVAIAATAGRMAGGSVAARSTRSAGSSAAITKRNAKLAKLRTTVAKPKATRRVAANDNKRPANDNLRKGTTRGAGGSGNGRTPANSVSNNKGVGTAGKAANTNSKSGGSNGGGKPPRNDLLARVDKVGKNLRSFKSNMQGPSRPSPRVPEPKVSDKNLQKAIDERIYKTRVGVAAGKKLGPNPAIKKEGNKKTTAIGNGSRPDALRWEKITGLKVRGRSHEQSVRDDTKHLKNSYSKKAGTSDSDMKAVKAMIRDGEKALSSRNISQIGRIREKVVIPPQK